MPSPSHPHASASTVPRSNPESVETHIKELNHTSQAHNSTGSASQSKNGRPERYIGIVDRIRDRQDVALVKRPPPHDNILVFRTQFPYHSLPQSGTYITFATVATQGKKYALAVDVAIAPRGYGLSCLYDVESASESGPDASADSAEEDDAD